MPVKAKRFMKCGHVGLGEYCHRCFEIGILEQKAVDALAGKIEGSAADFHAEAERLKGPSKRTYTKKTYSPV